MTEIAVFWDNKPVGLEAFPAFMWLDKQQENSTENRAAYIAYLCKHLNLPEMDGVFDAGGCNDLLNATIMDRWEKSINFRGTTDVVIAEKKAGEKGFKTAPKKNCKAIIELKIPGVLETKSCSPQAVCELVAGSFLNEHYGVVAVLTDLKSSWTFFWFAQIDSARVGLCQLNLKGETAAREAKFILESLDNKSCAATLPTTFTDRLSWAAMSKMEAKDLKRGRSDDGSVDGSHQTLDGQPPTGGRQPPMDSITEGNDAEGGMQMSDSVALLGRLAPHYRSSDVGNILDLLDMLDEEEKYDFVRSFVLSEIVPYVIRG